MPCSDQTHHHQPWPKSGTHILRVESCETRCGWCEYQTKAANNLRVHARRHTHNPKEHSLRRIHVEFGKAGRSRVSTQGHTRFSQDMDALEHEHDLPQLKDQVDLVTLERDELKLALERSQTEIELLRTNSRTTDTPADIRHQRSDDMKHRKIKIKAINDDRNRSVTFLKRKGGLFKKAHELSVLCSVDVAVIIFGHNKKLYEFSSGDINETIGRYQYYGGAHEHKGPEDFMRSPSPPAPPDVGPNVPPSFEHARNAPLDDAPNNLQRMSDEQNSHVQSSKAAHFLPAARIAPFPALQWDQLAPMSRQEDEGDIDVRSRNHTPAERYSDVFSSHPAPHQDSFEGIQPSPMQAEPQAVGQFGQHISPSHSPHMSPRLLPQQQQQTHPQPPRNDFYSRPRPHIFTFSYN